MSHPNPNPNPNWIWSQDHNQYYRQEFINGAWVTIWQPQHVRIDSGNLEKPIAPLSGTYNQPSSNTHHPTPKVPGSSQDFYYHPGSSHSVYPGAAPTLPHSVPRQSNYQAPQANPPYAGGSNHVTIPPTLQVPEPQQGRTIEGSYNGQNPHFEEVDHSFYVRGQSFFTVGKLIAVILTEEAGSTAVTDYNTSISRFSVVRFGQRVHTQVRRFIIVRPQREFSYACPIFTYGGRATLKPGVRADEHAIVYSSGKTAELLPGETGIRKHPICVIDVQDGTPLHKASRIYFGIHHPIQHNVKVKDLGCVHPSHIPRLRGYWTMTNQDLSNQDIEDTAAAQQDEVQQEVTRSTIAYGTSPTQNHANNLYTNQAPPVMRTEQPHWRQTTIAVEEDDEEEEILSRPSQMHANTAHMHRASPVMEVQQLNRTQPTIPLIEDD